MRTARFFVPSEWVALSAEAFCIPAGNLHKQIVMVLRMKAGDPISLMTNDGSEIEGHITEITRSAVMGVIAGTKVPALPLPSVTICAAMTKRDTFEWMLQKCTELGATTIIPLVTERVVKRTKELPTRLSLILKEASEQSGRVTIPELHEPMTLAQAFKRTEGKVKLFMHESGGKKFPQIHKTNDIALFIGPEGGFTDNELSLAEKEGAHIVTMGDLVLRAETAAIAGLTHIRFS
jgi:16S rRNA (uracil1498-N3)-methyltransferase